eukprot:Skav226612  [mRNA]  locus=scaffold2041:179570:187453:- [translate_table: standard]
MALFILGLFAVAFAYRATEELDLHSISKHNSSLSLEGDKCSCSDSTWEDQKKAPCCAEGLVCESKKCKPQLLSPCSWKPGSTQCAGSIYERDTKCEKDVEGKYRCCIKDWGEILSKESSAERRMPVGPRKKPLFYDDFGNPHYRDSFTEEQIKQCCTGEMSNRARGSERPAALQLFAQLAESNLAPDAQRSNAKQPEALGLFYEMQDRIFSDEGDHVTSAMDRFTARCWSFRSGDVHREVLGDFTAQFTVADLWGESLDGDRLPMGSRWGPDGDPPSKQSEAK